MESEQKHDQRRHVRTNEALMIGSKGLPQRKKTGIDRLQNRITELETNIVQMEQDLEDTIFQKIEELLDNIFENVKKLESKVHYEVNSLSDSEDFTYHLGQIFVGNPKVYVQVKAHIKSMVETSAQHEHKRDFSAILNRNRPITGNQNTISNSNNTQSNKNVNQHH